MIILLVFLLKVLSFFGKEKICAFTICKDNKSYFIVYVNLIGLIFYSKTIFSALKMFITVV